MYTLLTFPFICKPFTYSDEKEVTLIANTSLDYQGDHKCQPIFKFSGTGTHTITCNGESFTLIGDNKDITVDCKKGIVYYNDISNAMTQFSGDFITLNPETINTIAWTGTTGSTAPTLIYQDTNLVKLSYTDYSYTPSGGGSGGGGSGGGTVDEDTIVNVLKNKVISTLTTTVKTVVGAINSLKLLIDGTFNDASMTGNIITFNKIDGTTKVLEISSGIQGPPGEPGADGQAATITIGTTTSGTTPNVTNTGTSTNAVLNFTLQKGDKGDKGDTGATGTWDTTTQYPTLATDNKTVIGAINENKQQINVLKPVRNAETIEYYNSWSAWAGTYGIKLDKIGNRVFCNGILAVGVKDNGTIIFTVPDGFRPIALEPRFLKGDDGKNHHIDISPNGEVVVDTSGSTGWSTSSVVLIDFECNWEV